jgi:hypothetical protein
VRGSAASYIVLILRRSRQQAPAVSPASTPPALDHARRDRQYHAQIGHSPNAQREQEKKTGSRRSPFQLRLSNRANPALN